MKEGKDDEVLLVPNEVSQITRLSINTIRHYISTGRLPGVVRLGRRTLIRKSELLKWIENNTTRPQEEQ